MGLSYSPEFGTAFAPIAALMAGAPKPAAGDVQGRRDGMARMIEGFRSPTAASPPDVSSQSHYTTASDGHKIEILHIFPTGADPKTPTPAVLHIHGGGFILGRLHDFAPALKATVAATRVPFFSVDYRLAPEHPHPTPVEDSFAGLQWLHAHASELNVDKTRIGVMGESAGGGLAAALALLARDRNLSPPLKKQILIYPMLDDRNTTILPDIEPLAFWKRDDNVTGWGALLGDAAAGGADVSPYAAPARAESLKGLPETYIDVGTLDLFRDEDLAYAQRLLADGVQTEFHLYAGVPHAFELLAPQTNVTKLATANRAKAIMELWGFI